MRIRALMSTPFVGSSSNNTLAPVPSQRLSRTLLVATGKADLNVLFQLLNGTRDKQPPSLRALLPIPCSRTQP